MEYSYATLVHLGGENMYLRKVLNNKGLGNENIQGIGPEAVRFKYINDIHEHSNHYYVEGTIYQVGLDFVDIVDEGCLTTIMTEKITNIKWLDPKCREIADKCHCHDSCKCIEFHRCLECKDKDDQKRRISMRARNNKCMKCKKAACSWLEKRKKECSHHHDRCHQDFTCFCDHAIPLCDERFEIRLAGLTDDLNFQLWKHKGCKVRINI